MICILAEKEGIEICNGLGEGVPEFTSEQVIFNGAASKGEDYETFYFARLADIKSANEYGLVFGCTKTEFRPYDSVVVACLIAAKYHFKDQVYISTDGEPGDWVKGMLLASAILGANLLDVADHIFDKPSEDMRKAFLTKLIEMKKEALKGKPEPHSIVTKETAKLVKAELKKAFPKTKFSVRSDYNSINVRWENGPSTDKVENLVGHYKAGHFDGMTDCYKYDVSPYCNKYIFFHRDVDQDLYLREARRISKEWGVILPEDTTYNTLYNALWKAGTEIKTDLQREVCKEISETDY